MTPDCAAPTKSVHNTYTGRLQIPRQLTGKDSVPCGTPSRSPHSPGCGCEPCKTVKALVAAVLRSSTPVPIVESRGVKVFVHVSDGQ